MINAVKPFKVRVVLNIINEYLLERNIMNVISVVKSLEVTIVSNIMKEQKLERSLMNVISVVKLIYKREASKAKKNHTGEKPNEQLSER